ncbi:hypothetical protein MXB_64 [Myxobolus squamalis]|nr:hypothetical protein MXB_64 [Myxobolus squamalis]
MDNCGEPFVHHVAKNIFINEIIKTIHPSYDGNSCSPVVRHEILRMIELWAKKYGEHPKFGAAYDSLVRSGRLMS